MNYAEMLQMIQRLGLVHVQVEKDLWKLAIVLQRLGQSATCADWEAFASLKAASAALERAVDCLSEPE